MKDSFAKNDVPLQVETQMRHPINGQDVKVLLSSPPNTATPEDIQLLLWLFYNSDAARRFESLSRENGLAIVGKLEPNNDVILRKGNIVVWYDVGSTSKRLINVRAALDDLSTTGSSP